jgi:Flp pilus assembly protein TadG
MRVNMSRFSRIDLREERGVTLVIVAILIVALFGMLTLVVDVGGVLVKKRSMVAAADAAALAAAESCAVGSGAPLHSGGPAAGAPEVVADQYATKNASQTNSASTNIVAAETVGCESGSSGYVTVSYTAPQEIFFGPVIGTGSSTNVTAKATAEWVAGGATNPMPFAISEGAFSSTNCKLPLVAPPAICYIWEDNGGGAASNYGGSTFGVLDLNRWDIGTSSSVCNSAANDKGDNETYTFNGGYDGSTPLGLLHYPDPTYVCTMPGLAEGPFYSDKGLTNPDNFNRMLTFPVIAAIQPYQDRFNVIGYVKMTLVDVLSPKDGGGGAGAGDCTYTVPPTVNSVDLDSAFVTGTGAVGKSGSCPLSAANSDILTITSIKGCGNGANSPCATPGNYSMDTNGDHVVTFAGPPRTGNVTIGFHWETFGVCGNPPGGQLNNSGHCLVLRWEGVQLGNAPGGANFGIVGTRLCDVTISRSCKSLG